MANKDSQSEKDSAYISDLLEKLRQTIGQTSPQPEGAASSVTSAPDGSVQPQTVAEPETKGSADDNEATSSESTVPEGQDDRPPFDLEDTVAEEDRTPRTADVSAVWAETYSATADAAPVAPPAIGATQLSFDGLDGLSASAAEPESPSVHSVHGASPTAEEYTAPREAQPLSRTVMPTSSRISENARHPVGERYRELYVPEPPKVPLGGEQLSFAIDEPASSEMPVPDESEQEPQEAAPIPDAEQTGAPVGAQTPKSQDAPASVWDSLPPLETLLHHSAGESQTGFETPSTEESAPEDENIASPLSGADVPVFHATVARPKKTLADCEFVTDADRGIIRDKILLEPVESLGGEHAEKQVVKWRQELRRRSFSARLRVIVAGVLVCLLALLELVRPLTDWFLGLLLMTRVPGVVRLIDLQLLFWVCVIGYRPIYRGFAALRFKRVLPETLASLAAGLSVLAGVVFYFTHAPDRYLFGLMGALAVFGAVVADYFRVDALVYSFRAYAAPGHHFAGVQSDARAHRLLSDLYGGVHGEVRLMEAEPASRIDGYVAASRNRSESRRAVFITLMIACVAALVDLILLLAVHRGAAFAFWSAAVVFCAVLPLSCFATHRFMFRMLCARIAEERVGVTGENAVYEFARTAVMTFDDTEAFPAGAVKVNGIKLCGDFRLDKALYLVSSLFDRIGGPLNGVFRVSTADVRISDDVNVRTLAENGIEAQVNHEDVCVGTRAFLEGIGIEVFRDIEDERAEQEGSRVLYIAYRGLLCAKFYVHYEISTAFEKNVEYYAKHGVLSVILTADPLLNEALLDRISYISEYDVRIVKRDLEALSEEHSVPREADLISYGPRKTLRRMPFFFSLYAKRQRMAVLISLICSAVIAVLAPVLLAVLPSETVLAPFLCQAVALLPAVALGFTVRYLNPNP